MPKLINRDERDAEICRAVAVIVAREGLEAASVRRVARAIGLHPNALRQMWPSQAELHERCLSHFASPRDSRGPDWALTKDDATILKESIRTMVPLDEAGLIAERALHAYAARFWSDTEVTRSYDIRDWGREYEDYTHADRMGAIIRAHRAGRVNDVARFGRVLRRLRGPAPTMGEIVPVRPGPQPGPDSLEPEALHLLIVITGLSALLCDHASPLSPEAADRWLKEFEARLLDLWP